MLGRLAKNFYKKECRSFKTEVLILIDHIEREMDFALSLMKLLLKNN